MTGVSIQIEVQDGAVVSVFRELIRRLDDPAPALADIGEYGVRTTVERIESQNSDPLAEWAPLSDRYRKSPVKLAHHPDLLLVLYADLVGSFAWQAQSSEVGWGTNRVYAATQQFGREDINLPARPFVGLTAKDEESVLQIMAGWLEGAWQ